MTGHIRRRGKRSWELKFDLGTDALTGKRRIQYASFKGTKREAEIKLAQLVSAASTGEQGRASLCHHQRWHVRVRRWDRRHDRCVHHRQSVYAMHAACL